MLVDFQGLDTHFQFRVAVFLKHMFALFVPFVLVLSCGEMFNGLGITFLLLLPNLKMKCKMFQKSK